MQESTVTAKGQTTIPRAIREALGVKPGDRVLYLVEGGTVRLVAAGRRAADLAGLLPKPPRALTLAEMEDAVRGGA